MNRHGPGRWRRLLIELPASLAALAVAVVVEIGLRVTTLPKLARWLGTPLSVGEQGAVMPRSGPLTLTPHAKRQVRATRRVMRHWPFGDTCLRQALVSGQRLRRLDPALHVGVAKIDGEIRAHAWLTIAGGILDPLAAAASYQDLTVPKPRQQP
ncbi:MAG: lasso peptide biosynthesis B2 protein [Propionicimonas sp.]|jgi:hypothetical protein